MMLMTMLFFSPVVVKIALGVAIALAAASVLLRLVSDVISRGSVADVLALASVVAGLWSLQSVAMLIDSHLMLWTIALMTVVFSVVGWKFPFRMWHKGFSGRKSRRAKRVKYYFTASLLHAPWVFVVLLGSVRTIVMFSIEEPTDRMLMHSLLQSAEWGVIFLIFFCLLRMYRKHQFAALRRALILSVPLCVLFLQPW